MHSRCSSMLMRMNRLRIFLFFNSSRNVAGICVSMFKDRFTKYLLDYVAFVIFSPRIGAFDE